MVEYFFYLVPYYFQAFHLIITIHKKINPL
jgi:hypothetical protein